MDVAAVVQVNIKAEFPQCRCSGTFASLEGIAKRQFGVLLGRKFNRGISLEPIVAVGSFSYWLEDVSPHSLTEADLRDATGRYFRVVEPEMDEEHNVVAVNAAARTIREKCQRNAPLLTQPVAQAKSIICATRESAEPSQRAAYGSYDQQRIGHLRFSIPRLLRRSAMGWASPDDRVWSS